MKIGEMVSQQILENIYVITNNKKLLNMKSLVISELPENDFFLKDVKIGDVLSLGENGEWNNTEVLEQTRNILTEDQNVVELLNNLIEVESSGKCTYGLGLWATDFNNFIGAFTHREFVV